jgi:hypothetical protein
MVITEQMLHAAMQRAVELGVLPRRNCPEDLATNAELIQEILLAAFEPALLVQAQVNQPVSQAGALSH